MIAKRLTPILNVSDIQESFAWFEELGWQKGWDWGSPPHLRRLLAQATARFSFVRTARAVAARARC